MEGRFVSKKASEDIGSSSKVKENVNKMYDLMQGKFSNNKETLLDSFRKICELMEKHSQPTREGCRIHEEILDHMYAANPEV